MKTVEHLNPLTNPVIAGDYVKCGHHIYQADTDMRGRWKITYDGQMVAEGIHGQIELCAWFDRLQNEVYA